MARSALVAAVLAAGVLVTASAAAQGFPNRAIRLIVPYAPGGSVDLLARAMRQGLQDALGQPVIVDNRPGAGGAIGVEAAAKSPADGHTLVMSGSGAISVNVHLTKLSYDPGKDLAPVAMLTTLPIVVAVHPSLPVRSMQELVAHAKARPGTLNFSSNGRGSVSFLAAEIFKHMTGIRMEHIPYKGAAPGTMAIVAGEVQLGFVDSSAVMPQARAGTVRALAVTDPKRSIITPELPTIAESGFPGYAVSGWIALFAPAGTPTNVIQRLNSEVTRILTTAEIRELILRAQMEPAPDSPEALQALIKRELEVYGSVIQKAGIKAE